MVAPREGPEDLKCITEVAPKQGLENLMHCRELARASGSQSGSIDVDPIDV